VIDADAPNMTPDGGRPDSEPVAVVGSTVTLAGYADALAVEWCEKCHKPHRPDLRCWRGRYASAITATVLAEQGRICWICGGVATSADHVIARSVGGGDEATNLRPCCVPCNSRRYHRANPFDPERVYEAPARSSRWAGQ
jgi:hypothetical protein